MYCHKKQFHTQKIQIRTVWEFWFLDFQAWKSLNFRGFGGVFSNHLFFSNCVLKYRGAKSFAYIYFIKEHISSEDDKKRTGYIIRKALNLNGSGFLNGGGGGIRTHGTLARSTVFKTAPINRSGTPPSNCFECIIIIPIQY